MCKKTKSRRNQDLVRLLLFKRNPRKLSELTRHIVVQKKKWEDEEDATRAASCANASLQRVKESRWQQQTGAEGHSVRPRRRETSCRLPRGQTGARRGQRKKTVQTSATCGDKGNGALGVEPFVPSYEWQNDVKASVNNTRQISPSCHLLLVGAVVLDGTNG